MCQWVLALDNYAEVYKIVQPKQKRCEEAQVALSIAQENLKHKQTSLAKIQEQLNILQQQYNDSVAQLNELRNKKELTLVRLDRASTLTRALAEEQVIRLDAIHLVYCLCVSIVLSPDHDLRSSTETKPCCSHVF